MIKVTVLNYEERRQIYGELLAHDPILEEIEETKAGAKAMFTRRDRLWEKATKSATRIEERERF